MPACNYIISISSTNLLKSVFTSTKEIMQNMLDNKICNTKMLINVFKLFGKEGNNIKFMISYFL